MDKMQFKGIDVSAYNVVADYRRVAESGIGFAIIKIVNKSMQPDSLFETHWNGFESAGIPIQGVYNYSYATTVDKFRDDAKRVIGVLNGRKAMVWLDIEDKTLAGLGQTLIDGIDEYAKEIVRAGLQFGVYTYLSFYNSYLRKYSGRLDFPFWVARYPSGNNMEVLADPDVAKFPDIGKTTYGWQYSSNGVVPGVKGNVDLNVWYVDIERKDVFKQPSQNQNLGNLGKFKAEMCAALNLPETSNSQTILANTVTISAKNNKNHSCVTPLERILKTYGYYTGEIEADNGKSPIFGNGMAKASALYQSNIVGLKKPDMEWTKGNSSYKKALGIS
jgi:GH25 family lysozyme M1 (1,4-beta-N-acetylmuramidase)